MKRLLLKAHKDFTVDSLSPAEQSAINSVFAQLSLPMLGTVEYNESIVIDVVTAESVTLENFGNLNLPLELYGMWDCRCSGELNTIVPLNTDFINFLPVPVSIDSEGNEVVLDKVLALPHNWAGWADVVL